MPATASPLDHDALHLGVPRKTGRPAAVRGRLSAHQCMVFTRELATLLQAGLPLVRGLELLARKERHPWLRSLIRDLAAELKAGSPLSAAMQRYPGVFDGLYLGMVRAGEAGGMLGGVMERLAGFQQKSARLRGRVQIALVYPVIVSTVATGIIGALLVFVVPRFERIFADLLRGAPLPPLTRAVLATSEMLRSHVGPIVLTAVGCTAIFRWLRTRPVSARILDGALLQLPAFGPILTKAAVGRFCRTLGTLLAGGVPMLRALQVARDTAGNLRVAAAVDVIEARVRSGSTMAAAIEATDLFPPMVPGLVEVGEQTGQLPAMLGHIADIYDEEVDVSVAGLGSLIEPLLIVVLALAVGTIVIALFLPIIRIVQVLG